MQGGLTTALKDAIAKRTGLVGSSQLLRLFDGENPLYSNLFLDRIGPFAVLHLLSGRSAVEAEARREASRVLEISGADGLYLRVHARDASKTAEAELLAGIPVSEAIVREGKLALLVRPEANVNSGIFIDTREIRRTLEETSARSVVLNAFCFTGSLGLAASLGGAAEVVQVDASRSALRWAKENLELNRESVPGSMRFIEEDALAFMEREGRRGRRYDTIVLDPPAFGRSEGAVFSLERDIERLVRLAVPILSPKARIFLLCNHRSFEPERLLALLRAACGMSGRRIVEERLIFPPSDFPNRSETSISMRGAMVSSSPGDAG